MINDQKLQHFILGNISKAIIKHFNNEPVNDQREFL